MDWSVQELQGSFRGAVGLDGNPTGRYLPEVMIERTWDLKGIDALGFANDNHLSEISLNPSQYSSAAEMQEAILGCVVADAFCLSMSKDNPRGNISSVVHFADEILYYAWISNDNLDPQEQPRVEIGRVSAAFIQAMRRTDFQPAALQDDLRRQIYAPGSQLTILLDMCHPWFKKGAALPFTQLAV